MYVGFFDDMRDLGGGKNNLIIEKDNSLFAGKNDVIVRQGPFGKVVAHGREKSDGTIKLNDGTKIFRR